jgi:hypothetical protein
MDVASIVDSVLAGLRPRIMEEITRKMAEKSKPLFCVSLQRSAIN